MNGVEVADFTALSASSGFDFRRGIVAAAGVPEPQAWAMLLGGFGLIGATARRRRVRVQLA